MQAHRRELGRAVIPKKIWSFWLDGKDAAPALSQYAFDRWCRLNPSWDFTVLDRKALPGLLSHYPAHVLDLPPQALSDILRVRLLREEGGVWTDASVLPVTSLDEWLPDQCGTGFFAFCSPGPARPVSSWMLAAEQRNKIVVRWEEETLRYWQIPRRLLLDPRKGNPRIADPFGAVSPDGARETQTYPYHWFHYLFGYLMTSDKAFRDLWDECPRISAVPPHELQRMFRNLPRHSVADLSKVFWEAAVVHKLDWRLELPDAFIAKIEENMQ